MATQQMINYAMAAHAVRKIMRDETRTHDERDDLAVEVLTKGYGLSQDQAVKLIISYLWEDTWNMRLKTNSAR